MAPEPRVIWWLDQPILGQCCAMLHPSTLWVVVSPDLHCMIISGTISSPTTFPQNKTCSGAPSGCQLQSSAAPASDPGKWIKHKNISESSIHQTFIDIAIKFPREFARGTWSSGKWQVVPSREFTYPKFSLMFQKIFVSGNIFFSTFREYYWSRASLRHPDTDRD